MFLRCRLQREFLVFAVYWDFLSYFTVSLVIFLSFSLFSLLHCLIFHRKFSFSSLFVSFISLHFLQTNFPQHQTKRKNSHQKKFLELVQHSAFKWDVSLIAAKRKFWYFATQNVCGVYRFRYKKRGGNFKAPCCVTRQKKSCGKH